MLAISTLWNCHRHTDGEALLSESRTFGLTTIEVCPNTKISLFPGFRRVLQTGRARIVSLANFTPRPIDRPGTGIEPFELTSAASSLRKRAQDWTRITIDYAAGLEASFVVLRLGPTGMRRFSKELFRQVRAGRLHSREFVSAKLEGLRERVRLGEAWLGRARQSLEVLIPFAQARGIRLAITAGGGYEEGPMEQESLRLVEEFGREGALGYWHDFSEVQKRANLGLLDHGEWLTAVRPHLLGCYLSDLKWPDEGGRVPLSGMIDFAELMPIVPPNTPAIWQIDPNHRAAELRQMVPEWEDRFNRSPKSEG